VEPGVGASAISLLQSSQPPPIETVLATLLNELSAISNDVMLLLDDYHVIDARDVQERRTWSSWQCQQCAGVERSPRCWAGLGRYPASWSTSGRCLRLA
jgi:hypothetical protein